MMLFGAAVGFWVTQRFDGSGGSVAPCRRRLGSGGAALAAIHAFLVITLRANQIVRGSRSRSSPADSACPRTRDGACLADLPAIHQFGELDVLPGDLPVVGPILFDQSALVYASWILTLLVGSTSAGRAGA